MVRGRRGRRPSRAPSIRGRRPLRRLYARAGACIRLRFEWISRGDGVARDADAKPQKNVPQAEHMPQVMPRARSSKSSGRVRQMRQRSEECGCGCGCWCSGAVWVDGWAAFARVSGCRLCVINVCAATGEAWMLAARLSASGVATAASMMMPSPVMQECARKLRGACLSQSGRRARLNSK